MLKRVLSIVALAFTLSLATGLAEKQSPPVPDPSCYPCGNGGN